MKLRSVWCTVRVCPAIIGGAAGAECLQRVQAVPGAPLVVPGAPLVIPERPS
jgi:hypothetical protein